MKRLVRRRSIHRCQHVRSETTSGLPRVAVGSWACSKFGVVVMSLATRIQRKVWTTFFGEASWINQFGNFRTREQYGLINRPNYLYGMLRAADCAKYFGQASVTAIEFGVASGAGLLNMVHLAKLITEETGVQFRIVGFDTGSGLPSVEGHKDHPEIWRPGDFATESRPALLERLDGRAEIVWGDIADTIKPFSAQIDPCCPIGFISVDVDIYSAASAALSCLKSSAEKYLPAISLYFDDVSFYFANQWAGELAAISEFNAEFELRKIDHDRSLPGRRPIKATSWYPTMYVCHVLDHPARRQAVSRSQLTIKEHAEFMTSRYLF